MVNEILSSVSIPYPGKGDRKIRIFVPAHEEGERLPVIYMTDGQTCFDLVPGEYGAWYAHKAVRAEKEKSGRCAVIVGIHNDLGPAQRASELTPHSIGRVLAPMEFLEGLTCDGETFAEFVVKSVMPYVEEHFPVKKGRENTAFCGSSSGGLESFYIALAYPELFGIAGVFSCPFLLYPPDDLEKWLRSRITGEKPYLYMYSGGAEGMESDICRSTEYMSSILDSCYPKELYKTVIISENPHHEKAWSAVFEDLLRVFLDISDKC